MVATAKTRAALLTSIATNLADNTSKDITPADARGEIEDVAASAHIHQEDRYVFVKQAVTTTTSSTLADLIGPAHAVTPEDTTATILAGTFLVDVSFNWNHALTTSSIHVEFTLDATNIAGQALILLQEPSDAASWHHFGGHLGYFTLGSDQTITILMQFKSVDNTTVSSVRDIVVVLTRIYAINGLTTP